MTHPSIHQAVELASRFGFLSRSIYWKHITTSKVAMSYRVWSRLLKDGYFTRIDSTGGNFIKLSQNGRRFALSQKLTPVAVPMTQQLAHDELLMDFALSLEKEGCVSRVTPEIYYKSSAYSFEKSFGGPKRKIPDLYFSLELPARSIRFATEYERTRKAESVYRTILLNYASFTEVDVVLYIVNDEVIEKTIRAVAKKIRYPLEIRPLAFARALDVQNSPTGFEIRFQNRAAKFYDFVQEMRQLQVAAA